MSPETLLLHARKLYWLALDVWYVHDPHPLIYVSQERINRELRDHISERTDEASARCVARVKRRMLLGSKCPDPPVFVKGSHEAREQGNGRSQPGEAR